MFEPEESYSILRYVFKWNTTKENLNSCVDASSFARKVKERINDGGKFYDALGVIEANS